MNETKKEKDEMVKYGKNEEKMRSRSRWRRRRRRRSRVWRDRPGRRTASWAWVSSLLGFCPDPQPARVATM